MIFVCKLLSIFIIQFCFMVESLLVVSTVGIQLTTTFASGRKTTKFYDMSDVKAVIINEAITMVVIYNICMCSSCIVFNLIVLLLLTQVHVAVPPT